MGFKIFKTYTDTNHKPEAIFLTMGSRHAKHFFILAPQSTQAILCPHGWNVILAASSSHTMQAGAACPGSASTGALLLLTLLILKTPNTPQCLHGNPDRGRNKAFLDAQGTPHVVIRETDFIDVSNDNEQTRKVKRCVENESLTMHSSLSEPQPPWGHWPDWAEFCPASFSCRYQPHVAPSSTLWSYPSYCRHLHSPCSAEHKSTRNKTMNSVGKLRDWESKTAAWCLRLVTHLREGRRWIRVERDTAPHQRQV